MKYSALASFLLSASATVAQAPVPPSKEQVEAEVLKMLEESSYPIVIGPDGVGGVGAEKLLEFARQSQFVVLAEEHNTVTLPRLATSLLKQLQPSGYEYIATESGTAHARWASEPPQRGNRQAIFSFAHRYPYSLTFYRDAEANMFAEAGAISRGKGRAIWGVDQEFGAEPALEKIVKAAPNADARAYASALLKRAHEAESDRTKLSDTTHFIGAILEPQELLHLQELYRPAKNRDVQWLIQDLIDSNYIYSLYRQGRGHMNSTAREDYMKRVFMDEYRRAAARDKRMPKLIFKAGHWHALRGQNPAHVFTTGNMLSELAKSNGSRAFVISTYIYEPDGYMTKVEDLKILAKLAKPHELTLVMLEPLREKILRQRFIDNLQPKFVNLLIEADAALILGGEKSSSTAELDSAE